MAGTVDEARELSKAIQKNAGAPFLKERKSRWKPVSGKTGEWTMPIGDATVRAAIKQRAPNGAPEAVRIEAELPERLSDLGSFGTSVGDFPLADVGLA